MNGYCATSITGKYGECIVEKYLTEIHNCKIQNMTNDSFYKALDVDFLVNDTWWLEVKTDTGISKYNHFLFEDWFERKTRTDENNVGDGWFKKTECNYLGFYDGLTYTLYILNFLEAKPYVLENGTKNSWYNHTDKCKAHGYVVNVSDAIKQGLVIKQYDLKDFVKDNNLEYDDYIKAADKVAFFNAKKQVAV
jgi:hypothetical protein